MNQQKDVFKIKYSYERQLFDMNCNDCVFMVRSLSKRQKHVDLHYDMQKNLFNTKRIKLLEKGESNLKKAELNKEKSEYYKDKAKNNFKESRKMTFVFDEGSCSLSYGYCKSKQKDLTFITDTVMEENFNCFKHRKH